MRIAVCEDNIAESEKIAEIVKSVFDENAIECEIRLFETAKDFESSDTAFDLIFMDCRLPDGNGIDVARRLRETDGDAVIIYVTAYGEYVFDSFEVGAFRYLLKPIKENDLKKAVGSFIKYFENYQFVDVPVSHKSHVVRLSDIMYIEANDKRSIVRVSDHTIDSTKTMSAFQEEITSPAFFRTHRHYLLNMNYVADINGNVVTLTNGEKVEVSRRCLGDFNRSYINYIKYSIKNGK